VDVSSQWIATCYHPPIPTIIAATNDTPRRVSRGSRFSRSALEKYGRFYCGKLARREYREHGVPYNGTLICNFL